MAKLPCILRIRQRGVGSGKRASSSCKCATIVVPTIDAMPASEIISMLDKSGDGGFAWNMGLSSKPQDVLKFLRTVPKRVFLGAIKRPALKLGLVTRMFPGFQFTGDGLGIFEKLAVQAKVECFDTTWFRKVSSGTQDDALSAIIVAVTKDVVGITEGTLATHTRAAVVPPGKPGREIKTTTYTDEYGLQMSSSSATKEERIMDVLSGRVEPSWLTQKKKAKEIDFRNARSLLDPGSEELVKVLKMKRFTKLTHRIEAWLRTFLSTQLQNSVAQVILAKLEASLSQPIKYGREDHVAVLQPLEEDSSDDDEDEEFVSVDNPGDV
ncbi:unnamed protein product [Blumeria hordei]|uniref:Uncharacterized protein n=1 Tax=Blumeria hordei TaxID=2867405 RepID=A0A383UUS0_BLUHO|nr:unnamed protein product [Blumeria hordei]